MDYNNSMFIHFLILLFIYYSNCAFNPDRNSYDAYGLKIAMNDILLVQVQNEDNPPTFLTQFSPYNDTPSSVQCTVYAPDAIDHYIYTVAIGKNQADFYFIGELTNGKNGTFIGVAKYNSSSSTCDTSFSFSLQYFYNYKHQERYVLDVEPKGRFAYGFSNELIFMMDSQRTSIWNSWYGNLTYPHTSFIPHAIDLTENFGVISGFVRNPMNTSAIYIPIVYLINFNLTNNYPIVVHYYAPNNTAGTWQSLLTNSNANRYSAKYDMSVSINEFGLVLVGMQFINRVFLFSVNKTNSKELVYVDRLTAGRSLGNGKGVAWLENGKAAILVNTYSLNYQWSSSQVYFYDFPSYASNLSGTPLSAFPNSHQLLPLSYSSVFLNIISSPSSLALLDNEGNILVFNPTLPGFYPSVQDIGSSPTFTAPQSCSPGTYKNQAGIHDCALCPSGTNNPGNFNTQCRSCLPNSFCSLGAVGDVPQSVLETKLQATTYPISPESVIFDEILIQNMFNIGPGRCALVSPLFWALIVAGLALIVIIIMALLKFCIKNPRSKKLLRRLQKIFKHTDIIREGELWIGGLFSFCVIILVSFAYSFSNQYLGQYPLEETSDSNFACDKSIRNAKFESKLQTLSTPVTREEQKLHDILDQQSVYLNIDFVNTLINCDSVSLQALFGSTWSTIRWSTCVNMNNTLSLSILLPFKRITVQVLLDDPKTIGGLRIGMYGSGSEKEKRHLQEIDFYQSFFEDEHLLAQNLPINLDITKVINETKEMVGEESDFSGIYIPTFTDDSRKLFLSNDYYVRSALTTYTTLTVIIQETPYYVKNLQEPIAKRAEVIFHNLLFTIVCLEIFGLGFLILELIARPIIYLVFPKHAAKHEKRGSDATSDQVENTDAVTKF